MAFTLIYAFAILLIHVLVFAIAYKRKGLKVAIITSGTALALFVVLFVAAVNLITFAL